MSNGFTVSHDRHIERAVAAVVLRRPDILAAAHGDFAVACVLDIYAHNALNAAFNVRAAGREINEETVRAELERTGHPDTHVWLPAITAIDTSHVPPAMFEGWTKTIAAHAAKREAEANAVEELLRREDEIDEFALRDVEDFSSERLEANVLAMEAAVMTAAHKVHARLAEKKRNGDPITNPESATPPKPPRFGKPFIEFLGDEPSDDVSEVFEASGLIVRGEPSLFIGEPKVGKTFLVEDLVLHITAGRKEWCGVPIYRRARVLIFLREDSERTTRRRLYQLARGAKIEHWENEGFLTVDATSPLYFDDQKLVDKLEKELADYDICVIDSLSTIHNADENSVERMAPIMNRWRDLALGTNTAIALVHHFRKRNGEAGPSTGGILQRARGSSIIGATTRHAVGVDHGPSKHQIVIGVESNHEIDVEPFVIKRRFGVDDKGRKYVAHERVGSLLDARTSEECALIDPITLAFIRGNGVGGIGARDLRKLVIEKLRDTRGKGVRPIKVDDSAKRLETAKKIERLEAGNWRVIP